ncbi:MAG: chitobiase/beta-hexosaminidase C-terminal domain-containing protein [Prevotella sp.]|nr:chitobiase/beta-hexosaminidase C-terminal domain-containing protein [Prevotella sp.]
MRKGIMSGVLVALLTLVATVASASVSITASGGWFESAYVEFSTDGSAYYNVYYSTNKSSWTKIDDQLVRKYGSNKGRADVVGISAGTYYIKVASVNSSGSETSNAVSSALTVKAHDRAGFAHLNWSKGVGAYKNDGTLKSGANILYITKSNAKTITMTVPSASNKTASYTGLQTIINAWTKAYSKGWTTAPLCVRILGTLSAADMDTFSSSAEGIQIKGAAAYADCPITIEGVGNDAVVHGFGFLIRNTTDLELRNFAIMDCLNDCVSMDTSNSHIWVHNLDLFYGQAGSDADQKKGDGTVDLKGNSQYITISYNHFWDSGKSSLCGMKSESGPNYITYHHNWFDHSDSRHPRIRTMSVHVYNNYFDGNSKYGIGATYGSSCFVDRNYFRNCKYPMMASMQGSDAAGDGTFSSENGGMIKAFGNYITGAKSLYVQSGYPSGVAESSAITNTAGQSFDCYVVSSASTAVPSSYKTIQGGTTYNNFDTNSSLMYSYTADAASNVPSVVKGAYGAGRLQHGSYQYTFSSSEDDNYAVITALKSAVENYKSGSYYVGVTSSMYFKSGVITDSAVSSGEQTTVEEPVAVTPASKPTISVGTYTVGKGYAVTLSGSDSGATYYYSTDGSTFTKGTSLYAAGCTVYAYATLGTTDTKSSVVSKSVSSAPYATTPTITATANGDQTQYTVTVTSESGATIYYTTDGSTPTTSSSKYSSALTITKSCTIKALAVVSNKENSSVTSKSVTVKEPVVEEPVVEVPVNVSSEVCSFTGSKPSVSYVTVSGNYSTSKGTVTYGGVTYKTAVKMESATKITFTLSAETDVTFVFGGSTSAASKQFKLNGSALTLGSDGTLTKTLSAGTHTMTKSTSINLFAIGFASKAVVEDPTTWNFSEFTSTVTLAGSNYTYSYNGLTLVGNTSSTYTKDYVNKNGFHCNGASSSSIRHIKYTPTSNGTLTVKFASNNTSDLNRTSAIGTAVGSPLVKATCSAGTMTANVQAGKTYYIYFVSGGQTIKSITMTPGASANSLDIDFEENATAIENVNANDNLNHSLSKKVFVNGKLVIIKDGKQYNMAGQEM